jgi:hypothetical protein
MVVRAVARKSHRREGRKSSRSRLPALAPVPRIGSDKTRVSRWRTALKDLDAYHERVELAARRKAELEVAVRARAARPYHQAGHAVVAVHYNLPIVAVRERRGRTGPGT